MDLAQFDLDGRSQGFCVTCLGFDSEGEKVNGFYL